ncbi:uncharacterized protein LOC107047212 [Diachasma alloeum]|uniref:uncharacterized protein LOC107047212 n=1 Tax=Diachasma alloeum TaxID=454923 RepID=UPI0007384A6F|nr:uncharacterized protein LOC107047212 [Diachasma alloeum]
MDYRVAAAIAEKNEGETYLIQIFERLNLTVDDILRQHVESVEAKASRTAEKASTTEYKSNRIELTKKRRALRYRKEQSEGVTYQSQMGLISTPVINETLMANDDAMVDLGNEEYEVVFFDLETSGLDANCNILQIAAGTGSASFNIYIKPSKPIDPHATQAHGLTSVSGDLYLHGIRVETVSLRSALTSFLAYLQKIEKKCILVAHNLRFDGPRLLKAIERLSLLSEFQAVVTGFACSLESYKRKMNIKNSNGGALKLSTLARAHVKHVDEGNTHNASYDVYLLRHFACNVFTLEDILSQLITVPEALERYHATRRVKETVNTLSALSELIPIALRKKMAEAGIGFDNLSDAYVKDGRDGVVKLLKNKIEYKPRTFKLEDKYQDIVKYFEKSNK